MRKIILFLVGCVHSVVSGQIITTIAGGGTGGDGTMATAANIYDPNGIVFDRLGNLYFCEELGNKIRKIDVAGRITTIAGTGSAGYSGDNGPATNAKLNQPSGIAIDTLDNLFVADIANHVVRKINAIGGIITTICGNGIPGFSGDGGPALSAVLNSPSDVKLDLHGNIYIACLGSIRKISTYGVISTIAGVGGYYGNTGDGGLAVNAKIQPCRIWVDHIGNVFMTDNQHYIVRKIDKVTGIITRIAGNNDSVYTYNGDEIPATNVHFDPEGLVIDNKGFIYIADRINNRVRIIDNSGIIHTAVGNGLQGFTGDGGSATTAKLNWPVDLSFDKCNNLYISLVGQSHIRKVTFNPPPCTYLNVKEENATTELSLYPNPVHDQLHIGNIKSQTTYNLQSMEGRVMQQGNLKEGSNTISMRYLPPSMYMMVLTDEEGRRTVKKIVKE